jgi:hypothetical protein
MISRFHCHGPVPSGAAQPGYVLAFLHPLHPRNRRKPGGPGNFCDLPCGLCRIHSRRGAGIPRQQPDPGSTTARTECRARGRRGSHVRGGVARPARPGPVGNQPAGGGRAGPDRLDCGSTGGVHAPIVVFFPVLVFYAGWRFGARGAALAAVLACLAMAALAVADVAGWLPLREHRPVLVYLGTQTMALVLAAIAIIWVLRAYQNRIGEARALSRDLARQAAEADASRADLDRAQAVGRVGSWVCHIAEGRVELSAETCRQLGLPEGTEGSYQGYLGKVHPDDRARRRRGLACGACRFGHGARAPPVAGRQAALGPPDRRNPVRRRRPSAGSCRRIAGHHRTQGLRTAPARTPGAPGGRSRRTHAGARPGARRGGSGQPGQERIPGEHQPRNPHANERHRRPEPSAPPGRQSGAARSPDQDRRRIAAPAVRHH